MFEHLTSKQVIHQHRLSRLSRLSKGFKRIKKSRLVGLSSLCNLSNLFRLHRRGLLHTDGMIADDLVIASEMGEKHGEVESDVLLGERLHGILGREVVDGIETGGNEIVKMRDKLPVVVIAFYFQFYR